jgi:hypothetical protein
MIRDSSREMAVGENTPADSPVLTDPNTRLRD